MFNLPKRLFAVLLTFASMPAFVWSATPSLILISIDGMKPEYVTESGKHGLKIPVLRSYLSHGSYAEGVIGVVPSVTYPSHTTLVTGVWPAQHGVVDNTIFDPFLERPNTWYWDFADIRVPTLYTAAHAAGIKTASVGWPVTLGAPIDYNIAEGTQSEHIDKPATSPYNPADIPEQLGIHPAPGTDQDVLKTTEAIAILKTFHPGLLLVHLTNLDHQEHLHGPFSAEANATLESIDAQVGQIEQTALAIDPHARIVIVSDHGFLPVDHRTSLNVLLVKAGLIQLGPEKPGKNGPSVVSWQAEAWNAGGADAIMLQNPKDPTLLARVRKVLEEARADATNGIESILEHDALVRRGGFPEASFLVDYKDGYYAGNAFVGPAVVADNSLAGMHGYLPSRPAMRSAFMIQGEGIAEGRDLGVIDMRQIAPTLADLLKITLPDAKQQPLQLR